jgi:hypothetical protein
MGVLRRQRLTLWPVRIPTGTGRFYTLRSATPRLRRKRQSAHLNAGESVPAERCPADVIQPLATTEERCLLTS